MPSVRAGSNPGASGGRYTDDFLLSRKTQTIGDQAKMTPKTTQAPPVSEEIHLPGPTLVPFVNAAGLSLAIFGVAFSWFLCGAGVIIFLISLYYWLRDVKSSIGELPAEH
jgi:hypothetical protein